MWTCKKCGEQIEDQFDSCWKCSGAANEAEKIKPQRLKWYDFLLAAMMSYTLPWLVVFLDYLSKSDGWRRSRTILYYHIGKGDLWIALFLPAAITFLVLCPFLKYRTASWLVYILAGICWLALIW